MKLLDVINERSNNFNLIRMSAALLVIVGHSYALALGSRGLGPVKDLLGISLGTIAVDIFFITSGLLVTKSLLQRSSLKIFIISRVLRIFPALLISVLFCVVIGAIFSTFPLREYITHPEFLSFIIYNSSIVIADFQELPGVFYNAPLDRSVNGSLWTLPWELRMYIILIFVGITLSVIKKLKLSFDITTYLIISIAILCTILHIYFYYSEDYHWFYNKFVRFTSSFFIGASLYILKSHIVLNTKTIYLISAALIVSLWLGKNAFFVFYTLSIPYLVLCAAYMPKGKILNYNNLGDLSYGTYIYAWPVQQALAISFVGITPNQMSLLTILIVLFLSMFSWYFIERPSLNLKRFFV
ncbi:acyltransferase family protein [Thalassotalea crassostreae]|uniref:acyltransferase family protein n=1 Tax=Thalassotalea crassostreae TaxID=1763536 RepID=UPI0008396BC8|nr:acyltransferase [Thalassotalea crassostreae]